MIVGCLEKELPFELQPVNEKIGLYNLYVPGSLNLKEIKDMFRNPPKGCNFITMYATDRDKWKTLIEKGHEELGINYFRFEKEGCPVMYFVDLHNVIEEKK